MTAPESDLLRGADFPEPWDPMDAEERESLRALPTEPEQPSWTGDDERSKFMRTQAGVTPRLHPTCPHGFEVGDSTECLNPECWPVRDATNGDTLPFLAAFEDGVDAEQARIVGIIDSWIDTCRSDRVYGSVCAEALMTVRAAIRGGE